jgi:hypothetical protein
MCHRSLCASPAFLFLPSPHPPSFSPLPFFLLHSINYLPWQRRLHAIAKLVSSTNLILFSPRPISSSPSHSIHPSLAPSPPSLINPSIAYPIKEEKLLRLNLLKRRLRSVRRFLLRRSSSRTLPSPSRTLPSSSPGSIYRVRHRDPSVQLP